MAPTTTTDSPVSTLSTKDRHKLRKPVVEKMRRDRINSCIEQLKVLLEKEFHKRDPNVKLEKADILEMTVVFLKQQLRPRSPAHRTARRHGYSHCWKETLHFLSANSLKEATLPNLLHLQAARRTGQDAGQDAGQSASQDANQDTSPTEVLSSHRHMQAAVKQLSSPDGAVWRPW